MAMNDDLFIAIGFQLGQPLRQFFHGDQPGPRDVGGGVFVGLPAIEKQKQLCHIELVLDHQAGDFQWDLGRDIHSTPFQSQNKPFVAAR